MTSVSCFIEVDTQDLLRQALYVRRVVFTEEQGVSPEIERDDKDILGTSTRHFLVLKESLPIGAGRVIFPFDAKQKAKVQRIAVLKNERGSGVGRLLMKEIHKHLPNVQEFVLSAQLTAVPFYEGLGYVAYGEPYTEAGIPHCMMVHKKGQSSF